MSAVFHNKAFDTTEKAYLIFDGDCSLCHWAIRSVARRDVKKRLLFVPGCSPAGEALLLQHGLHTVADQSVVLIDTQGVYTRGDAVKKVLMQLPSWKVFGLLLHGMPPFLLDWGYRCVAHLRKKFVVGKRVCTTSCCSHESISELRKI